MGRAQDHAGAGQVDPHVLRRRCAARAAVGDRGGVGGLARARDRNAFGSACWRARFRSDLRWPAAAAARTGTAQRPGRAGGTGGRWEGEWPPRRGIRWSRAPRAGR